MAYTIPLPDGFLISDDRAKLDRERIHRFLSEQCYWALGRSRTVMDRGIDHSLSLGAYAPNGEQVGFARVISDHALFARLSDVFVLPAWRGRKLGEALVRAALAHPDLAGIGRWTLNTADAQGLYTKFGFAPLSPDVAAAELRRMPA